MRYRTAHEREKDRFKRQELEFELRHEDRAMERERKRLGTKKFKEKYGLK